MIRKVVNAGALYYLALLCVVAFPVVTRSQEPAQLSEVERLRLELHQTQIAYEQVTAQAGACRAQLRSVQLSAEQAALKASIEQAHPGFSVDVSTGVLRTQEAPAKVPATP